jgi:hypothetical protein
MIRSASRPTTVLVPSATVMGRSVLSRRVRQGIPRTVVSSLHPAGVGQDDARVRLEVHEVEVARGVDEGDPGRVGAPGQLLARPRVHREDQGAFGGDRPQGAQQVVQHTGVVDVGGPVQRDEPIAPGLQAELVQRRPCPRPLDVCQQGVHHHVPDEVDLVLAVALGPQVVDGVGGGGEEQVADAVGRDRFTSHDPPRPRRPVAPAGDHGVARLRSGWNTWNSWISFKAWSW